MDNNKRRVPRLRLTSDQFKLNRTGKVYGVFDVSEDGIGLKLIDNEDLAVFTLGSTVEGILKFFDEYFTLKLKVSFVHPSRVGLRFETPNTQFTRRLGELLSPEHLGSDLKLIPIDGGRGFWFHGRASTDFLVARTPQGALLGFTLQMLGMAIRYRPDEGLTTGWIKSIEKEPEISGLIEVGQLSLEPDSQPDLEKLSVAKKFILGSNLPEDIKTWAFQKLTHSVGNIQV